MPNRKKCTISLFFLLPHHQGSNTRKAIYTHTYYFNIYNYTLCVCYFGTLFLATIFSSNYICVQTFGWCAAPFGVFRVLVECAYRMIFQQQRIAYFLIADVLHHHNKSVFFFAAYTRRLHGTKFAKISCHRRCWCAFFLLLFPNVIITCYFSR